MPKTPPYQADITEARSQTSLPLCVVPGSLFRFEVRFRWSPLGDRGQVVAQVTDDDTGELLGWWLKPSTHGFEELATEVTRALRDLYDMLEALAEPF